MLDPVMRELAWSLGRTWASIEWDIADVNSASGHWTRRDEDARAWLRDNAENIVDDYGAWLAERLPSMASAEFLATMGTAASTEWDNCMARDCAEA